MIRIFTALIGATMLATPLLGQGATAGTKSVQLSKVVLDTDTAETVARVKEVTLCVFPSNVKITKEKKTHDNDGVHRTSHRHLCGILTTVGR